MAFLRNLRTSVLPTAFGLGWQFGAVAGLVYWSYRYDYEAALLSVLVPLYGAITVARDLLP